MATKPNAPKGKKIDVAGMLHAATTEGYVGSAEEIYEPGKDTTVAEEFKQAVFLGDPDEGQKPLPQPDSSTRADLATKAIQDDEGNSIKETYATNENLGITKYPHFSITNKYSKGTTVYFDEDRKLYQFTVDHEPGAWDISQVTQIDHISANILQKLGDEEKKTISQKIITKYINEILGDLSPLMKSCHLSESSSHLIAFSDVNNIFLGGIKNDGTWDIPQGIPAQTKEILDDIQTQILVGESDQYILIIKDKNNNFLLGFRQDGSLDCPNGITKEADERLQKIENEFHLTSTPGYLFAFCDKNNVFLGGITNSGRWVIPQGISKEAETYIISLQKALEETNIDIDERLKDTNTKLQKEIDDRIKLVMASTLSGILGAFIDSNNNVLWRVLNNGSFEIANSLLSQDGYSIEAKDIDGDTLYHIIDKNKNLLFNIRKDGTIVSTNGIILDGVKAGATLVDSESWLFAITDVNGNVLGGIDKYGALFANEIKGVFNAKTIESENYQFAFTDINGNILFGIRKDGKFFIPDVLIEGVPEKIDNETFLYVIQDINHKVLWAIYKSGKIYQPYGIPEEAEAALNELSKKIEDINSRIDNIGEKEINNKAIDKVMLYGNAGRGYLGNIALQEPGTTDYCIIMMYGQSLSNGSENHAGFDDPVVEGCYMLGNNVWTTSGSVLNPLRVGGSVRSDGVATGTRQDTIVSTVNTFVSLYKKERPWDKNTKFIACSMGVGGKTVAQLSGNKYANGQNTTLRYPTCNGKWLETNVRTFFESVKAIADKEGKTISLSAVFWKQGESDYGQDYIGKTYDEWKAIQDAKETPDSNAMNGSKDAYKVGLTTLKEDIFALAKLVFGEDQSNRPVFMPYSVCGAYISNAYQTINEATSEMANEQDDVVQVGPTYVTPDYGGGHLAMNGYRWFGEYCAKALYYVYLKHMDFRPLQPESFDIKGNKIFIYIQPIVPPLRIDRYTPGDTYKNLGFSVRMGTPTQLDSWKSMASGGLQTITNIEIVENCIILTCGNIEQFTGAVEVSYAGQGESGYWSHNQGAGNIRDCDNWQAKYAYREDSGDHGNRNSFNAWYSVRTATDTDKENYIAWSKENTYNYGDMCLFTINTTDYVVKSNKDNNKNIIPYYNNRWNTTSLWSGGTKATEEQKNKLQYWDESYATSTGYVYGDKVLFNIIEVDGPVVLTNEFGDAAGTAKNKNRPFNPLNYHTTDVKGNGIVGKPYPMQNWLLNFYKRIIIG